MLSRFLLGYQAILVEWDYILLETTNTVNPASFLNEITATAEPLGHNCIETMEAVYTSRLDLKDVPLESVEVSWYTDGSSFIKGGTRMAGYAVTTIEEVIEAQSLPAGTSAKKGEIIALTRALELAEGKKVNVWTDS